MKTETDNEHEVHMRFITELGDLIAKYCGQVSTGNLMGALEVVKMRIFIEAHNKVSEMDKVEEQGWRMES